MTITLIEQHEYDMLMETQAKFPNLTYQNEGYDKPDKSKWSKEDLEAHKTCEDFLRKCINGFSQFNHFKLRKGGKVCIRFQYDWTFDDPNRTTSFTTTSFTGVGYLEVQELLNGFNPSPFNKN